jgi:hypothetical protein
MQVDQSPFPINKLDLKNPPVLIWSEQADTTKGKNVVMEKLPDGEETITIIIRGSTTGNHEREAEGSTSARDKAKRKPIATNQEQVVRPPQSARARYTVPRSNPS